MTFQQWRRLVSLLLLAGLIVLNLTACQDFLEISDVLDPSGSAARPSSSNSAQGIAADPGDTTTPVSGRLVVHYIDVGQGDSILIVQNKSAMLIDAGNASDADLIIDYLQTQGISKLDYVIGTHPHSDHIGGLADIIASVAIGKVILAPVQNNTQTFENVLQAVQDKGLKLTRPVAGSKYTLGKASFQILGPNGTDYEDLNNYSVVIRVTFGQTAFLFVGDAEMLAEKEMLAAGYDLQSDVLKAGHHGSHSSTSSQFLKAVDPDSVVISVGADNSYGHPAAQTLDALQDANIDIYRTDLAGTIIATSDGSRVRFNKQPRAGLPGS